MTDDSPRSPTFGFPRSGTAGTPEPIARPTPLPKRPKGRWFIGVLLFGACGYGGYQVWDAFFRYRAYGTVIGRNIELSPPGTVWCSTSTFGKATTFAKANSS